MNPVICRHRFTRNPCFARRHRSPAFIPQCNARAFDFASVEKESGRRHRAADKREAERAMGLVKDLCALTPKQLGMLSKHLMDEHLRELLVARSLSHTNNGRQRQERLLAKIIQRDLDTDGLAQLQAYVKSADLSAGELRLSPEQEARVAYWRSAVLAGEQEAESEVLAVASQLGGSTQVQQVRQLLRQVREAQSRVVAEMRNCGIVDTSSGSGSDEDDDSNMRSLAAPKRSPALLAAQKEFKRKRSKMNKVLKELVTHCS